MQIVNVSLLKHPLNYVIVFLMILIAGAAVHLVLDFYGIVPATRDNPQK